MKWRWAIGGAVAYAAVTYYLDVVRRPRLVAAEARAAADRLGKPLLNVGAGTPGSSLRVRLLGPTAWGDVNCDLRGSTECVERACVSQCDAQALPYADGEFGAVIASHVLEHVPDPVTALAELHRVADEVFAITPKWWAPHTWLYWDHRWYRREDGRWVRLWGARG